MLKKNKIKILLSSLVTLSPIVAGLLLWDKLPANMTTHWGMDGTADGSAPKAFAVFGLPFILLALYWLCLWVTSLDKKQKDQNPKAFGIIFWIMPAVSLAANGMLYSVALGGTINAVRILPLLLSVMFICIGNYLPKVKPNRTMGIRIFWTLGNEENWSKTHRLAGKVYVLCGLVIVGAAFLPMYWMISSSTIAILTGIVWPLLYSYSIYRKHRKTGIVYDEKQKNNKVAVRVTSVFIPLLLVFVGVLMFTGNIEMQYGETAFTVQASYYEDLEIPYADIDTIQYRDNVKAGMRTFGFGSAKLHMGIFRNDEFGDYTRYCYIGCDAAVVLQSGDKILVLNGKTAQETKEIFNTISAKIEK